MAARPWKASSSFFRQRDVNPRAYSCRSTVASLYHSRSSYLISRGGGVRGLRKPTEASVYLVIDGLQGIGFGAGDV